MILASQIAQLIISGWCAIQIISQILARFTKSKTIDEANRKINGDLLNKGAIK